MGESDGFDLIDRKQGIFTRQDRKFITGEEDFSGSDDPQTRRAIQRGRIRDRLENAIYDFLLLPDLPTDDIVEMFSHFPDKGAGEDHPIELDRLASAWQRLFYFYFLGLGLKNRAVAARIIAHGAEEAYLQAFFADREAYVPVEPAVTIMADEENAVPFDELAANLEENLPEDGWRGALVLEALVRRGYITPSEAERTFAEVYEIAEEDDSERQ